MKWKNNILKDLKSQYIELLSGKFDPSESKRFLDILIEEFFGITKIQLALEPDHKLSESEMLKLHWAIKDLLNNKPIQYITGVSYFHDLKLNVNESVLIPRPETEELVGLILNKETTENLRVIDIGTGSGCIALALKKHLSNSCITAVDMSSDALLLAQKNALQNQLQVKFKQIDILNTNSFRTLAKFDIVVSNPPYVTQSDKTLMKKNVVDYEPYSALFVEDENPLLFYKAILEFCKSHLNNNGRIYFEINEQQGDNILQLLKQHEYNNANICQDIHGKNRFVVATNGN